MPAPRNVTTLAVSLSGGVDSSVVAALLQQKIDPVKIQLQAVHMTNWNFQDDGEDVALENVCYEQDWKDAVQVAEHLKLPIIRHRLESAYWTHVFEPYLEDLVKNGNMGNPDINCNVHIKFGALREKIVARHGKQTWLATGHYARLWYPQYGKGHDAGYEDLPSELLKDYKCLIEENLSPGTDEWLWKWYKTNQCSSNPWLLAAADTTKDQSYFLAGCSNTQLAQVLFPLGDLHKKWPSSPSIDSNDESASPYTLTVRELAIKLKLPTANKRESMGICFVGKRKSWINFVRDYTAPDLLQQHVQFVDIDSGRVIGQSDEKSHPAFYTIGRGARVGGADQKYFVVGPSMSSPPISRCRAFRQDQNATEDNVVWVCAGTHHPALFANSLTVKKFNWIMDQRIPDPLLSPGHDGRAHKFGEGNTGVLRCKFRFRHLQELMDCEVVYDPCQRKNSNGELGVYTIYFEEPLRGITPGQMVVLYAANGLVCLGGGPIATVGMSLWEQEQQQDHLHGSSTIKKPKYLDMCKGELSRATTKTGKSKNDDATTDTYMVEMMS